MWPTRLQCNGTDWHCRSHTVIAPVMRQANRKLRQTSKTTKQSVVRAVLLGRTVWRAVRIEYVWCGWSMRQGDRVGVVLHGRASEQAVRSHILAALVMREAIADGCSEAVVLTGVVVRRIWLCCA